MVLSDALSAIDKQEISYELFCRNATFELVDIRVGNKLLSKKLFPQNIRMNPRVIKRYNLEILASLFLKVL